MRLKLFPKKLLPLFSVMLFDHTSVNITFPVLTFVFFSQSSWLFPIGTSLAERTLWYGVVMSLSHIGGIISTPVISTLSDHVGRKRMLFIAACAAFVFAISCTLGILFASLALLIIGKVLGGMLSRTNAVAQAIIGDMSSREEKAVNMGYLQVVISIGACIGPIIGGYFAKRFFFTEINYAMPYLIAGVLALIAMVMTQIVFKETLKQRKTVKASLQAWVVNLRNKRVLQISLLLIFTQLGWSTYYQYMPPLLKTEFHLSVHVLGVFIGIIALWLAIASMFGVRLLKSLFTLKVMVFISVAMMLLGALLTVVATQFATNQSGDWLVWLGAIPMAMGDVIVYSVITALYSNAVSEGEQGSIMGLCFIIVPAVWALTGFLGGVLGSWHIALPAYFTLGILTLLFVSLCVRPLAVRKTRSPD